MRADNVGRVACGRSQWRSTRFRPVRGYLKAEANGIGGACWLRVAQSTHRLANVSVNAVAHHGRLVPLDPLVKEFNNNDFDWLLIGISFNLMFLFLPLSLVPLRVSPCPPPLPWSPQPLALLSMCNPGHYDSSIVIWNMSVIRTCLFFDAKWNGHGTIRREKRENKKKKQSAVTLFWGYILIINVKQ